MKILVTGGCGFIGSNFIRHILKKYKNYKIVNFDNLTYAGNPENLKDIEHDVRYAFVKGDICDQAAVEEAMVGCNIVINFAAESHVDRSIERPENFVQTNFYGAYILLEEAKKKGVEKFMQISTDEVYGSIVKGSFTEESPLAPNSPYSASKAAADLLARSYYKTYGFPVLITRSSNNFGPYQYPEKVMPLFITKAFENKRLPLYGDGGNVRDWLFVIDNCEGIDLVLHKGKFGEAYNIGDETEISNLELTKLLLDILGKPHSLIEFVKDRLGHDRRYSLDCRKIKKLGWLPKCDFKTALLSTVEWYGANKEWWIKLK
ncbi:MAG: dTDP-glucose 4,6-dehydratase [Candidatus Omnitrophica bacterium CG07_land_8_20_14_0_80_42_15]|uniref:dTDP-glucose 4,6-dehydratase n=1 Tax=Candidatus Aquitaenariimonas noxiae TaxID=1974741 RepID=A0A2J0L1C5_9BACT|nr:MAG: dTDP-glucose 4,6-dehydratase [Candidatus Omnitrophica bacterium CG07_land_8_20_14_0_80_42_15]